MPDTTQRSGNNAWIIVLFVIAAIFIIWALSSARRANAGVEANEELLEVPNLDVVYTVGGPQRFAEPFQSAIDDLDEEDAAALATPEDLLWTALIVDNDGNADADDVQVTVPLANGAQPTVLADLSGFGDIGVETTDAGVDLDIGDVDAGDTTYVFLGFDPAALPEAVAESWAGSYRSTVGTITADTDGEQSHYYGTAL